MDTVSSPPTIAAPTLGGLLRRAAETAPDAIAFTYREEQIAYAAWNELSEVFARYLHGLGVRRGDVVALLLPSTPFYQVAYLAAARLGAVTAGINARYRRTEIGQILQRCAAKVLIAVDTWHGADFHTVLDALRPALPDLQEIVWLSGERLRRSTVGCVEPFASAAALPLAELFDSDDPVAIVFTSGTTGIPKGACYTHRNLMALAEIETRRYGDGEVPYRKHLAAGLSFAHIGTMARIAIQIAHRTMSIIHDSFDPALVLETVEREQLPHLGGIPTQIIMLLEHPDRRRRDLRSLRTVLLGGAPSSPELIRRIQNELKVAISMRYSSTEVGIATCSLPDDSVELLTTTVGKATAGVELRIVGEDDQGRDSGAVGEVVIRSPATMRYYWRDPQATAAVVDSGGWIHTGDLGFLDAAGYLHLRGRRSEMFIRGGYNVYPAEIEDYLAKHPKVARVAVVGVADAKFGEIGWAFVVARDPQRPPTLTELREYLANELASFKRPDGLTVLEELPLTPMFKVDKRALQRQLPPS